MRSFTAEQAAPNNFSRRSYLLARQLSPQRVQLVLCGVQLLLQQCQLERSLMLLCGSGCPLAPQLVKKNIRFAPQPRQLLLHTQVVARQRRVVLRGSQGEGSQAGFSLLPPRSFGGQLALKCQPAVEGALLV